MKPIKVYFDKEGNSLDVWFEEPRAVVCEETGDEIILKKDPDTKKVIGFEKLNFVSEPAETNLNDLPVEVIIK